MNLIVTIIEKSKKVVHASFVFHLFSIFASKEKNI